MDNYTATEEANKVGEFLFDVETDTDTTSAEINLDDEVELSKSESTLYLHLNLVAQKFKRVMLQKKENFNVYLETAMLVE